MIRTGEEHCDSIRDKCVVHNDDKRLNYMSIYSQFKQFLD
jgi:hypothetical protein